MGAPESRSSVWGFVPFHRAGTQPDGGATEASNGIPERSPPIGPRAASFFNFTPELWRRRRGEARTARNGGMMRFAARPLLVVIGARPLREANRV